MSEINATVVAAQLAEFTATYTYGLNTAWLIITGTGILMMQAGFMALEVGATRAKNVKATLFKNIIDHAIGAVAWYCVGFSLFLGDHYFAAGTDVTWFNHYEFEFPRIFQQYGFAVTSSTIVSGALLSRCRLRVYVGFSLLLALYIYPIVAHWCWVSGGFLYKLGYLDFAGSGVVHLLGGMCAMVGAMACGPRVGRFHTGESERSRSESFNPLPETPTRPLRYRIVDRLCCKAKFMYKFVDVIALQSDLLPRDQPGHSAPMQCLGALMLYVAWFSFNAGSSGGLETIEKATMASRAAINTMLAAGAATVTALFWSDMVRKQYEIDLVVNGLLSGMVAVTAPCGYCEPWAAIAIGVLSIPVYVYSSKFVLYGLNIDDPIDASSVHCANGALGVIWTGLVDINSGLFYSGSPYLLGVQCLGVVCIAAWGFVNAFVYFYGLKAIVPRLLCCFEGSDEDSLKENSIVHSPDAQLVGLDFLYFGGSGFPEFDVEAVSEYNATQRIKEKFRAKKIKTMRIFDREAPEGSEHGGKHFSARLSFNRSSTHLLGTSHPPTPTGSQPNTPRGSTMPKRPSEQTLFVDAQMFVVNNPANDEDDGKD